MHFVPLVFRPIGWRSESGWSAHSESQPQSNPHPSPPIFQSCVPYRVDIITCRQPSTLYTLPIVSTGSDPLSLFPLRHPDRDTTHTQCHSTYLHTHIIDTSMYPALKQIREEYVDSCPLGTATTTTPHDETALAASIRVPWCLTRI